MFLHKLTVYKNSEILRQVEFKLGLNLIINSTSGLEKTGNSVGKSTPSRLLDYIFLSDGKDIYIEAEFKKNIPEVFEFINTNKIIVELSFTGYDNRHYLIGRNLSTDSKTFDYYINSNLTDKKSYTDLVSSQIFGLNSEKPSLRVVSHKFIRNTNEKMQNTTRFLHGSSKPDVYDQLYLFLFGFNGLDLLRNKAILTNNIATKTKHLAAYRDPYHESALQRMIKPLKAEENIFEKKISEFNFKDSQESSVKILVTTQSKISDITIEYSKVMSRIDYLNRSISNLKSNTAKVDGRELSEIYEEAGIAISGNLKKSYEDLLIFHNAVVSNKINLINKDIEKSKEISLGLKKQIDDLHEDEASIFKNIKEPDTLKSIGQIYNDLSNIRRQIGSVTALLDKIENTKSEIESLRNSRAKIIKEISNSTDELDGNVEKFNVYFGELSKYFYDERYIFDLRFDTEIEKCRYEIACITPNSTGGKKKGELSAFDLAYISFVNESKLKRPTFVVHDSIEDVDVNQVFDIFQQANQINGQYIVALLSDKISDERFKDFLKSSVVLELSESDKFFKF
ncbi:DUF2326 domain-containing protein [Undibacterium sp. 5I1]|uniref:DUF2326 domain-containing protein n=1 Tax=unclassified Undibacterium TaxID=2630295 RepID=UPI002AB4E441|nr:MULTISPECIES: DUF2326 domain-containing protein [unclassified Undibacterium]MDY7539159.1 DUF2326 domain-containing protein [Undibacterium sp. 5I1]MEB0232413.1 DUF2326 domain-containing protein [Undibacterium sp. 10I3]MEB0257042.1 DUF2326 domain-containing protein [Undibacterium sp. 5I1]